MLQMHMTNPEEKTKARSIATKLNKSFFSHGHALSRDDAKEIGLNVIVPDAELEKLMWDVHTDFESELNTRVPFDPLGEFLKDPQAAPLLQSPPPIHIPPQLGQQAALQLLQNYLDQQINVTLPTVEVELKLAFMESVRNASEFYTKNRVLAQRKLDMSFDGNMIALERRWRKISVPSTETSSPTKKDSEHINEPGK